jgi:hypothetical protein
MMEIVVGMKDFCISASSSQVSTIIEKTKLKSPNDYIFHNFLHFVQITNSE